MLTHALDLPNQFSRSFLFADNRVSRVLKILALLTAFLCTALLTTNSQASSLVNPDLQPHPSLTPQDVVEYQLAALKDTANGGIEATFRFASPANKRMTGPLARFTRLFDATQFQAMLKNTGTQIKLVSNDGFNSVLLAGVVDDSGALHWYRFQLSKQTESPYANCWMTDSVMAVAHPGKSA